MIYALKQIKVESIKTNYFTVPHQLYMHYFSHAWLYVSLLIWYLIFWCVEKVLVECSFDTDNVAVKKETP